ncbi:MAG TPA: MetS family NSS transporter small subunit [Ignavibacteriaceae bacterium]|nr:MetS family NSS transporter small subunit [Ignavibacteriaceae bacterium]HKJ81345.1 MetS family NSS transporter small subunit [Ignavibacteriaceae bacterium]
MNIFTILTAVVVLGIVWGGLTFFLTRAMKYEKMKTENGEK